MKTTGFVLFLFFAACQFHPNPNNSSGSDSASRQKYPSDNIPEFRKEIKAEPVAEFRERTDNPLNNWYFLVRLFETEKTFQYRVTLQFEEIKGEDTLYFPNFGIPPKPVIRKGQDKYSCIIGFMDKDQKFREYKKVFMKGGNQLKIVTLNRYTVVTEDGSAQ